MHDGPALSRFGRARQRDIVSGGRNVADPSSDEHRHQRLFEIISGALALDQRANPVFQFLPIQFAAVETRESDID